MSLFNITTLASDFNTDTAAVIDRKKDRLRDRLEKKLI